MGCVEVKTEMVADDKDWWDELNDEERSDMDEGLLQADRGETVPHEEVMKKYDKWRANYPEDF